MKGGITYKVATNLPKLRGWKQQFPSHLAQVSTTGEQHPWLWAILILGHIRQKGTWSVHCHSTWEKKEKTQQHLPASKQLAQVPLTLKSVWVNASHMTVHMWRQQAKATRDINIYGDRVIVSNYFRRILSQSPVWCRVHLRVNPYKRSLMRVMV